MAAADSIVADLRAESDDPDAEQWLGIAQAFAGPPGQGRG